MSDYFNPDNDNFMEAYNKKIYVDKSLLIEKIYQISKEDNKFICVSRPRRFGKSTDADMLVAYFSKGCNSSDLFDHLDISKWSEYKKHLNKHNVIFINIQEFYNITHQIDEMTSLITTAILRDIDDVFPNINYLKKDKLSLSLKDICDQTKEKFIIIIDEWDCVLRNTKSSEEDKDKYLEFMNSLFKGKKYAEMVYMTGILPIKKYGDESAINMFKEISMIDPIPIEEYMGFTDKEVKELCNTYNMDYNKMKLWYDGYHLDNDISIYNPRSIVSTILDNKYTNHWSKTGAFSTLKKQIIRNYDGLKEDVENLIAGQEIKVSIVSFQNDMSLFNSKDDVFTLLIHLGYLGYNNNSKTVYIPNKEVLMSFVEAINTPKYQRTYESIEKSQKLLEATWNLDEKEVAKGIEYMHDQYINSNQMYNNENSLYTTIFLSYYTAQDYYTITREFPTGKGFADIVFIPYNSIHPAMIIELKYDKSVNTAINQIKNKNYPNSLELYHGNLLLVGITYDKDSNGENHKHHICQIEKFQKD
ncbi:MAG: ATP-binding protein [Erysipelotrichaceae bacterium]|nr:ATP-binding protein [Erysipelotrichaceae bacterium]